ncbi:MAG: hypothetical protein OEZ37_06030, partial [Gemmatimonadota bacterium]|nr:hypothetical protein [Gemmatimonadota bacterium]
MKRFAAVITFALALALDPGTGWAQPLATSVAWDDASWAARPEGLIGSLTVPARADRPSFRLSRAEVFATGVLVVAPASILTGLAGAALENTFTECDYCEFHGAAGFILGWGLGAAVVGAPLIHAANKGRGDLHYGMIS